MSHYLANISRHSGQVRWFVLPLQSQKQCFDAQNVRSMGQVCFFLAIPCCSNEIHKYFIRFLQWLLTTLTDSFSLRRILTSSLSTRCLTFCFITKCGTFIGIKRIQWQLLENFLKRTVPRLKPKFIIIALWGLVHFVLQ